MDACSNNENRSTAEPSTTTACIIHDSITARDASDLYSGGDEQQPSLKPSQVGNTPPPPPPPPPMEQQDDTFTHAATTTSCRRWFILAAFCVFGFSNQVHSIAFTTIVRRAQEYYDISSLEVNVLAILFPIVFLVFIFPGCALLERYNLRSALLAGSSMNAVSAILRFVSVWYPQFWLLVVAQLSGAVAQIFFFSFPPVVASSFFPNGERTLATAVGTLFGFVGVAIGMFYSPQVLDAYGSSSVRQGFAALFGSQLAFAVCGTISIALAVPTTSSSSPGSTSADNHALDIGIGNEADHYEAIVDASTVVAPSTVFSILKVLMRHRSFVLLCTSLGLVNGVYTGLAACLSQVVQPFDVSEAQTGYIALSGILGGAVMCAVVGFYVDWKRYYKVPILILYSLALSMSVILAVCMRFQGHLSVVTLVFFAAIAIEILVIPALPVVLELSVELTFPHAESISSGIAVSFLNLWMIISVVCFSIVLGDYPQDTDAMTVMFIVIGCNAVAIALLACVEEKLVRFDHETKSPSVPKV